MKKFILIVTALMMVTLTYAQQDMRSIQVIGRASISALPQEFSFSVPIEVKNMNYDQCYNELVTKMDLLNKDLKKAGYGDQQVKVQNLSVRENYTWEQSKRIFQGYIGSVSVTIKGAYTTSQLNTVLKVLKQHECLYSLSFNLSELQREDLRKQAIDAAVKNALANAQQLASSSSVKLGEVLRIDYNDGMPMADELMPRNLATYASYDKSSADMILSPQEISIEKFVNIVYRIER